MLYGSCMTSVPATALNAKVGRESADDKARVAGVGGRARGAGCRGGRGINDDGT